MGPGRRPDVQVFSCLTTDLPKRQDGEHERDESAEARQLAEVLDVLGCAGVTALDSSPQVGDDSNRQGQNDHSAELDLEHHREHFPPVPAGVDQRNARHPEHREADLADPRHDRGNGPEGRLHFGGGSRIHHRHDDVRNPHRKAQRESEVVQDQEHLIEGFHGFDELFPEDAFEQPHDALTTPLDFRAKTAFKDRLSYNPIMPTSRARLWGTVFLVAATLPSGLACIWDGDTLAAEVRHRGHLVLDALTGRFDRFPPEYYQKRYELATERIAKDPNALGAYDNAAVACERLGRTDEAIEWMLKKQKAIEATPVHDKTVHDDARYRFHANIGTFYAHRWVAGGAKRDHPDALAALDHLKKCIAINPEAHFGREVVQLGLIEWFNTDRQQTLGGHLADRVRSSVPNAANSFPKVIADGLAGLILLGSAWESVDVYNCMARALHNGFDSSLSFLAALRVEELLQSGKRPFDESEGWQMTLDDAASFWEDRYKKRYRTELSEVYPQLRAQGDEYVRKRNEYVLTRLAAGRHPDSDGGFWSDWSEPERMALPDRRALTQTQNALVQTLLAGGILAGVVFLLVVASRVSRSRRLPR